MGSPTPSTTSDPSGLPAPARRRAAIVAGHRGDQAGAEAGWRDPDPAVRAAALGALRRSGALGDAVLADALRDPAAGVRRRACEEAAAGRDSPQVVEGLVASLDDREAAVAEAACFALGELLAPAPEPTAAPGASAGRPGRAAAQLHAAVAALGTTAGSHADPLCREAAVAALGAIAQPAGLPFILAALGDKAAVRRRAVLALAPFAGPEVDEALVRAAEDRDWQVRQAAEDLRG